MITKGLKLVNGSPYEEVIKNLSEAQISHQVKIQPERKKDMYLDKYFRDSRILITDDSVKRKDIEKILGGTPSSSHTHDGHYTLFYWAQYEISQDFDWAQLDGEIRFEKGRLVERVGISLNAW